MSELRWLDRADPPFADVHPLVVLMAQTQAAVGWLTEPSRAEADGWLQGVLDHGGRMAAAYHDDQLVGLGYWQRQQPVVLAHSAQVRKVMVHPAARGLGVGRRLVTALIADATAAGVELLLLDARGNNHGALHLYDSLGFVVSGRRPDLIAVGSERFDQVLMHLDLRIPGAPVGRHGGRREGPGRS